MSAPSDINAILYPIDAPVDPWNTTAAPAITMTYQFASAQPGDLSAQFTGWTAFTSAQITAVQSVFAEISSYINVNFAQVTGQSDPDIELGRVSLSGEGGQGGFNYSYFTDGQGHVTSKTLDGYAVWRNDLDLTTQDNRNILLHELGHTLMLKHPGAYDAGGVIPPGPYLPAAEDNNKYTVMSYTADPDNGLFSDHMMPFDIAALQARFGANMTTATGNNVYTGPAGGRIQTIWDAGGTDTFDASAIATAVTIDLHEGAFSSMGALNNLAIAYNVVIENANGGAGDDTIRENSANNAINGGGGTDTVVFAGARSAYTLTDLGGGSVRVVGPDGTDTLSSVERLQFDDQTVTWPPAVAGSVSINDVSITEGNSGTQVATFTVTRAGGTSAFAVNFVTSDGTATVADGDYVAASGTLSFGSGVNTQTISVTINGDTKIESNETFSVNLSAATNGAAISDATGLGTITNDDANHPPTITSNGGGASAGVSIAENSTAVTTVTATDPDAGQTLGYSLSGGADMARFQINAASGVLSFLAAPDFENPTDSDHNNSYIVQVRASDGSLFDDQVITVSVTDVAPIFTGDGNPNTLIGTPENDTISGLGGNDALSGGAGNDILIGGPGLDVLTGGPGNDTFVFQTPSDGMDTITDFTPGQDIFQLSAGGFGLAAGSLAHAGVTLVLGPAATGAGPTLIYDISGNVFWDPDGTGAQPQVALANVGPAYTSSSLGGNTDWQVVATGDFNHDGTGDIIWRSSSSGQDLLWLMNNGQMTQTINLGGNTDWSPVATGDFNHDGTSDIVWRSASSGQDLLWTMGTNGQPTATIDLGGNTDWKPVATGDFNHDGTTDIIWRSTSSGQDLLWLMNNGQMTQTINLGGNTDWKPAATGDFNHDGTTDIIWRSNGSGADLLWTMANGQPVYTQYIGGDLNWSPVATGDFNHDGADDIVWHSAGTGADLQWSMGYPHPAITASDFTIA